VKPDYVSYQCSPVIPASSDKALLLMVLNRGYLSPFYSVAGQAVMLAVVACLGAGLRRVTASWTSAWSNAEAGASPCRYHLLQQFGDGSGCLGELGAVWVGEGDAAVGQVGYV
jgi:hypothetical protein